MKSFDSHFSFALSSLLTFVVSLSPFPFVSISFNLFHFCCWLVGSLDICLFLEIDCYGNDPNRGYAMHLSYDSTEPAEAATWKGVKGCVPPWPCWKSEPHSPALPPSSVIPTDNHSEGSYVLDPMGVEFAIVYAIGFLLVVSLVFNCQLANRLKGMQQHSSSSGRLYRPVPAGGPEAPSASSSSDPSQLRVASGGSGGLEEPLLSPTTPANGERRGRQSSQRPSPPAVEESKEEAADP